MDNLFYYGNNKLSMTVNKFNKASRPPLQWRFHFGGSSNDEKKKRAAFEHAEQALRFCNADDLNITLGKTSISIIFLDSKTLELFDSHFHYGEPFYWEFLEFRPQELPHIDDNYLRHVRDNLTALAESHDLEHVVRFSIDFENKFIWAHADSEKAELAIKAIYATLENGDEYELVVPPPEYGINRYNPDSAAHNYWQKFLENSAPHP